MSNSKGEHKVKSRGENRKEESTKEFPKVWECQMIWQNLHGAVVDTDQEISSLEV